MARRLFPWMPVLWTSASAVAGGALFLAGIWTQARATQTAPAWPDSLEALVASPGTHKLLYEDASVRLLEIIIQPGETEKMHGHRWPLIYGFNSPTPAYTLTYPDGSRESFKRNFENETWQKPQCITATDSSVHKLSNTDSFPTHIYNLEFKRMVGRDILSTKTWPRD